MRIITKFTLLYLILLFFTLIIAGIVTYQSVKEDVKRETDFSLRKETRIVVNGIDEGKPIEALENSKIKIQKLPLFAKPNPLGTFSDTLMMHRGIKRMEVFRSHTSSHKIKDQVYSINITDVFIEENDMLEGVTSTMVRLFIFLSIMFIVFGFIFSRIILSPFRQTLAIVNDFDIDNYQSSQFPQSSTKEFSQLNKFLDTMMKRVSKEYHSLKEFSENASHEMQTPLAIAKGKLELLQESKNLEKEDLNLIVTCQKEIGRLSTLTQSLALLTKLENDEFRANDLLDFSFMTNENLATFKELAKIKDINILAEIEDEVQVRINESLAQILVSNLFKNAIQHNILGGQILVKLSDKSLSIKNTGSIPSYDTTLFFKRFSKNMPTSNSLGLGLSIIKKICDLNDFEISYIFDAGWHDIKITF